MSDFSLEHGSIGSGIIAAVVAGIKYLLIPLILLIGASSLLVQAAGQGVADQIGLEAVIETVLVLGIPIALLSFFRGFYPRGSISRFTFGIAVVALVCLWIWFITRGGNLVLEFDRFGLSVSFTGLVLLFILAAALKGVYYLAEMLSYRREWLRSQQASPTRVHAQQILR
jgi:hypothetical protein